MAVEKRFREIFQFVIPRSSSSVMLPAEIQNENVGHTSIYFSTESFSMCE